MSTSWSILVLMVMMMLMLMMLLTSPIESGHACNHVHLECAAALPSHPHILQFALKFSSSWACFLIGLSPLHVWLPVHITLILLFASKSACQ